MRCVPASDANVLPDPTLWPPVQSRLCWTQVLAPAPLGVLCPDVEPGHPEKPHTDLHLQSRPPDPYCSSPGPSILRPLTLWRSTNIQHASCPTHHLLLETVQQSTVFFIFLQYGCMLLFPPSLIGLLLVSPSPSPSSLGPFFSPAEGRVGGGGTMIRKQVSDLMLSE